MIGIAKLLLARDEIDANARGKDEKTPFHVATRKGSAEIAKLLLARDDINVNARDEYGRTPLHEAARKGNVEIAKLLPAQNDSDPNSRQMPMLLCYASPGVEAVKLLLARDAIDFVNARDKDGRTLLHEAAQYGWRTEIVELLLAQDDIDVSSTSTVFLALTILSLTCYSCINIL